MDALPDPRARLEAYARQNLPRYTSYPTAPHFGPMEEATYRAWLREIRPGDTLSLYLHVPFCKELCWYCGCHTAVTRNQARLARYADGLESEAGMLAAALPVRSPVESLHFGGGTPSAIGARGLRQVMRALRAAFAFRDGAELSVELDPRTLDDAAVATLGAEGFNRASLGVQDMDPGVQKLIGRIQPAGMVQDAVQRLRAAGIAAINFDLMYGLPGQDAAHVAASARFAAEMGADRVAVFGYAHVPWMKPHQKAIDEAALPGTMARMEQAEAAERALLEAGYVAIGLDHFARPEDPMAVAARAGVLRRNFQGYTTDRAPVLLGLGASAIGALPQGYAQNIPDERGWLAAVEAGRLPVGRGLALTEDDRVRRIIIESVMCDLELDLARVPAPVWESAEPRLAPLLADGLARLAEGKLRVTEAGRRFVRHVAACFDAKLGAGPARHSRAV
jgi:oxygen-independent coproporphyrinogen-3 oxidase